MKRLLSSLSTTTKPLLSLRTSNLTPSRSYGSVLHDVPEESSPHPTQQRQELVDDAAYDRWLSAEEQWESALEDRGLYRGNYTRLVILYTLVPLSTLLVLTLLLIFPYVLFPLHPAPPLPLSELILSTSFYCLIHVLRVPLFSILSFLLPQWPNLTSTLHRALLVLLTLFLRLLPLPILSIPQTTSHHPTWRHPAFVRVWFVAMGWAFADAVAGVYQGYQHLSLYRNVLIDERYKGATLDSFVLGGPEEGLGYFGLPVIPAQNTRFAPARSASSLSSPDDRGLELNHEHSPEHAKISRRTSVTTDTTNHTNYDSLASRRTTNTIMTDDEIEMQIERDVQELLDLKAREEVEDIYGMPFIRIPVFISCLIRINALIHTLGLTLLLSAAYIRSSISLSSLSLPSILTISKSIIPSILSASSSSSPHDSYITPCLPSSNTPMHITFPIVFVIHFALLTLHSPPLLAKVGVHTASYVALLVALGVWFAGMGVWEAVE